GDGYCPLRAHASLWIEKTGSEVGAKVENTLRRRNGLRKKTKFFRSEVAGTMEAIAEGNFPQFLLRSM
ncbi:hypothetical protein JTL43_33500, partial [Pseudomonas aeruginosa]|nr:hypothetical protein [Pseudomonas aeruginosa]